MPAKLTILLSVSLILAVACGTAEAPGPTAVPAGEPTAAPEEGETSQPTAVSQETAPPAEVEIYSGEVRIMVGDFASERFDIVFSQGLAGDLNYGRILHGFLIADNEQREMVPGIAREWNLSDDCLTWTFTIREGVLWHDGTELVPEDVLWTFQHVFGPQAVNYAVAPTALRVSGQVDTIAMNGRDVSLTTTTPATELGNTLSESGTSWYSVMPAREEVYNEAAAWHTTRTPLALAP